MKNAATFDPAVDDVFARIASRYDLLCDIFSVYAHRVWKNRMAQKVAEHPGTVVLDVASGTGDIPFRTRRRLTTRPAARQKRLIVSDLCPEMLAIAAQKLGRDDPRISYCILDAHGLQPIESSSIDIYTISFAMKICERDKVLAEAYRVLKPGGAFFCLEAARIPVALVHKLYLKYMDFCLPLIARIATGGDASAYNYFLKGIHEYPTQAEFMDEMRTHGFQQLRYENLTAGIVALHQGIK